MIYELKHHGIKGQKWGERNGPPYPLDSNKSGKTSGSKNSEAKQKRKEIFKNRRSMSDQELRKEIERIRLEKELKSLTEQDLAPGKAEVKKIVAGVAYKTLVTALSGMALYALSTKVSGGKIDRIKLGQSIVNQPGKKDKDKNK